MNYNFSQRVFRPALFSSYRPESEAISREDTPNRACIPAQSDNNNSKDCLDYAHDKEPMRLFNERDLARHVGDLHKKRLDKGFERIAGLVDLDYGSGHTNCVISTRLGRVASTYTVPPLTRSRSTYPSALSQQTQGVDSSSAPREAF